MARRTSKAILNASFFGREASHTGRSESKAVSSDSRYALLMHSLRMLSRTQRRATDLAANMIGRSNARRGARRIFAVLQNRRLNQHIVYTVLDEVRFFSVILPSFVLIPPLDVYSFVPGSSHTNCMTTWCCLWGFPTNICSL